jgi:hypothetical protein
LGATRRGKNRVVAATRTSTVWERYAWVGGSLFVLALLADFGVAIGIPFNQNDSAAKIATALDDHSPPLLVIAGLSVVYAAMFPIYLWKLYDHLRGDPERSRTLAVSVLVGGALFVALHATSDVGITGLLGAKLASYGAQHDHAISYTLYLMTFAISSVGDVFGSVFLLAAGVLALRSGLLPQWLAYVAIIAAIFLFLQGFGLGGALSSSYGFASGAWPFGVVEAILVCGCSPPLLAAGPFGHRRRGVTRVERDVLVRRGFVLEGVTLGWNVVGIVVLAVAAFEQPDCRRQAARTPGPL